LLVSTARNWCTRTGSAALSRQRMAKRISVTVSIVVTAS
jgi:hypothetical protein